MYHLHVVAEEQRQKCFDSTYIRENVTSSRISPELGSQVLVPKMSFSCNGIITNLIVNLTNVNDEDTKNRGSDDDNDDKDEEEDDKEEENGKDNENQETDTKKSFPRIQVWRPLNSSYFMTGCYNLSANDIKSEGKLANVSLRNDTMRFQRGDIIGYYIPIDSLYSIQNVLVIGNISYNVSTDSALDQFTINASVTVSGMLPIIQVIYGKE